MASITISWPKVVAVFSIISICMSQKVPVKHTVKHSNAATLKSMRCYNYDETFSTIHQCFMKPINRTLKIVNLHVALHKTPITNSTLEFRIYKKSTGGYKPFVIGVTLDICRYLSGRKNPIFDWFYALFSPYSNVNHTCPYSGYITIKDFPCSKVSLPSIFPNGDYRIEINVGCYNVPRAAAHFYVDLQENSY